jgi:hypothetical protein
LDQVAHGNQKARTASTFWREQKERSPHRPRWDAHSSVLWFQKKHPDRESSHFVCDTFYLRTIVRDKNHREDNRCKKASPSASVCESHNIGESPGEEGSSETRCDTKVLRLGSVSL